MDSMTITDSRESFERIALPNFRQPINKAIADDHWQTWQEAWEAAIAFERERCAALCESHSADHWHDYKDKASPFRATPHTEGMSDGAAACADAIRKLTPGESATIRAQVAPGRWAEVPRRSEAQE